ncbi:hypothetical protein PR048_010852 [Dryococelus australis]|uniref:Uncharacterized protein n=1 Tax=Dryococelus australis TaxID=614101 RepID=A0ABQ9I4P8_9NEOP|nr:hypothetical protein PR048_010852 [Dryococelus australis]
MLQENANKLLQPQSSCDTNVPEHNSCDADPSSSLFGEMLKEGMVLPEAWYQIFTTGSVKVVCYVQAVARKEDDILKPVFHKQVFLGEDLIDVSQMLVLKNFDSHQVPERFFWTRDCGAPVAYNAKEATKTEAQNRGFRSQSAETRKTRLLKRHNCERRKRKSLNAHFNRLKKCLLHYKDKMNLNKDSLKMFDITENTETIIMEIMASAKSSSNNGRRYSEHWI